MSERFALDFHDNDAIVAVVKKCLAYAGSYFYECGMQILVLSWQKLAAQGGGSEEK